MINCDQLCILYKYNQGIDSYFLDHVNTYYNKYYTRIWIISD